jgi:hypothetical protein
MFFFTRHIGPQINTVGWSLFPEFSLPGGRFGYSQNRISNESPPSVDLFLEKSIRKPFGVSRDSSGMR